VNIFSPFLYFFYNSATGLNPNTNYSINARAVKAGNLMFDALQSPFGNVFNVATGEIFLACVNP